MYSVGELLLKKKKAGGVGGAGLESNICCSDKEVCLNLSICVNFTAFWFSASSTTLRIKFNYRKKAKKILAGPLDKLKLWKIGIRI